MAKRDHTSVQEITIKTIDGAIHRWFDLTVAAHVESPSQDRHKVPVLFASGERFVTSRDKRGVRDKNGVLILPLISVRRSGIEPDPSMQALGAETARLNLSRKISGKTNDLKNLNALRTPSNRIPDPVVYEITSIPFPDRSIFTYEIMIQAQYITQMNSILEKMFHELDLQKSFVATFDNSGRHPPSSGGVETEDRKPLDEGYVVGFFDSTLSDSGNFEEFTDQERIVRYMTSIRVPTTLQLDPEGEKPAVKVEKTAFSLDFGNERVCFVDDPEDIEVIFGNVTGILGRFR